MMATILSFAGSGKKELWLKKQFEGSSPNQLFYAVNAGRQALFALGVESQLLEEEELDTISAKLVIQRAAETAGVDVSVVLAALQDPNVGEFRF